VITFKEYWLLPETKFFINEIAFNLGSKQVPRGITDIAKTIANLYLKSLDLHHKFMQTGDEEYRIQFREIGKEVQELFDNAKQIGMDKEALYKLSINYYKHLKREYNEEHGYTSQL